MPDPRARAVSADVLSSLSVPLALPDGLDGAHNLDTRTSFDGPGHQAAVDAAEYAARRLP